MKTEKLRCRLYYSQADTIEFRVGVLGERRPIIVMSIKDEMTHCYIFYSRFMDRKDIPNLSVLSEEELFQQSCVWDVDISFELVRAIQLYGSQKLENYTMDKCYDWEHDFEYN